MDLQGITPGILELGVRCTWSHPSWNASPFPGFPPCSWNVLSHSRDVPGIPACPGLAQVGLGPLIPGFEAFPPARSSSWIPLSTGTGALGDGKSRGG